MNYWWANQGQTHRHELSGGYLWAPKLDKNGRHRLAYDLMLSLKTGDCVFSYFKGSFRAVGAVMKEAQSCARPDFGLANQYWDSDGWLVLVEFHVLENDFDPKTELGEYAIHGPSINGPISSVGGANMEYLYALPAALGANYLDAIAIDVTEVQADGSAEHSLELRDDISDKEERRINERTDIGPTEIRALTLARRGQGFFRKEVARLEHSCRLTGVTEQRHLRASHIKPWSKANDIERLDGSNGLLLSPHVDHLFDEGYISFRRNGTVLQSPQLSAQLLVRWRLDASMNVGNFSRNQEEYLEYHRDEVFKSSEN
jgi:hypothetical protein